MALSACLQCKLCTLNMVVTQECTVPHGSQGVPVCGKQRHGSEKSASCDGLQPTMQHWAALCFGLHGHMGRTIRSTHMSHQWCTRDNVIYPSSTLTQYACTPHACETICMATLNPSWFSRMRNLIMLCTCACMWMFIYLLRKWNKLNLLVESVKHQLHAQDACRYHNTVKSG